MEGVMARMVVNANRLRAVQLVPFVIDDEGPLYGVPRLVADARARGILERLQRLSEPYGTRLAIKGWYAELELPAQPRGEGRAPGPSIQDLTPGLHAAAGQRSGSTRRLR
jgi:hypothetical protein